MTTKKHLSLAPLINGFKKTFTDYQETRRENSTTYSTLDTALSGLACMFYKSANMVNYQERMEQKNQWGKTCVYIEGSYESIENYAYT